MYFFSKGHISRAFINFFKKCRCCTIYSFLHKYEETATTFNTRKDSLPEIIVITDKVRALYIYIYINSHCQPFRRALYSGTNM